jgi:methyl-accepting chemotaxis protein
MMEMKVMIRSLFVVALGLTLSLALAGCGQSDEGTPTQDDVTLPSYDESSQRMEDAAEQTREAAEDAAEQAREAAEQAAREAEEAAKRAADDAAEMAEEAAEETEDAADAIRDLPQ